MKISQLTASSLASCLLLCSLALHSSGLPLGNR